MAFGHHPSGRAARLALLALGILTIIFAHPLIPSTDCAFAAQVTIAWGPDTSTQTAYTVPSLSEGAICSSRISITPRTYVLSILTSGAGNGTVTSSPTVTTFNAGTSVTLTATTGAISYAGH